MILRHTEDGKEVKNFKGLDRAVKHFEAGDISQIMTAHVCINHVNVNTPPSTYHNADKRASDQIQVNLTY